VQGRSDMLPARRRAFSIRQHSKRTCLRLVEAYSNPFTQTIQRLDQGRMGAKMNLNTRARGLAAS
jgi:hypothetical protein